MLQLSSLLLDSIGHLKLAGAGVVKRFSFIIIFSLFVFISWVVRLCDLHKSVNQSRHPSSTTSEDDYLLNDPVAWAEVKGGKKGDVLKLVSYLHYKN